MATSASPATDVSAVLPVTPTVGRIAQQAPAVGASFPQPSALFALGQPSPTALTYDATGLLRAFGPSLGASAITTPTAATVDAAALTGANADAAQSGLLNSPVTLQPVPANALGAIQGLLAGQSADQSLSGLQTNALNTASTGLNLPSSAAAVLNASGALQTLTPDQAAAALTALQGTDLGQAAAALNVDASNASFLDTTGLLLAPGSDSTSQALSGLLSSNLSQANAQFSANLAAAPAVKVGPNQALSDVLASDVNLTTAAAQAAAATATVTTAAAVTGAAVTALPATPTAPVAVPAATTVAAAATPTPPAATPATPVATAPPVTATAAPTVTLTPVAPTTTATTATPAVNLNFLVDAAAQAANNIASNPNYAALAATLYVHAAISRAQVTPTRGSNVATTDVANLPPPVAGTLGIRAARRI